MMLRVEPDVRSNDMASFPAVSNPTTPMKTRSNTGCWTCRLRRKKCDERLEACSPCVSLGLDCDGYGPRPQWMDGGVKERQMAHELREKISRHRKRRQIGKRPTSAPTISERITTAQYPGDADSSEVTYPGDETNEQPAIMPPHAFGENDYFTLSSMLNDDLLPDFDNCMATPFPAPQEFVLTSILPQESVADSSNSFTDSGMAFTGASGTRLMEDQALGINNGSHGSTHNATIRPWDRFGFSNLSFDPKANPAAIEFYYVHVMPNLFPYLREDLTSHFYAVISNAVTAGSEALLSSILALSAYFQSSGLTRFGLLSVDSSQIVLDSLRVETLKSLRDYDADADDSILLCLIHVRLLQIHLGQLEGDQFQKLIEKLNRPIPCSTTASEMTTSMCLPLHIFDILQSASSDRKYVSITPSVLEMITADKSCILGPESWVFAFIADTNNLRHWKNEMVTSRSLNIAILVKKAVALENRLKELQSLRLRARSNRDYDIGLITDTYVAGIKIYLHVVVSGAFPEVSDIQDAIDELIGLLQRSTNFMIFRRLSWPICVAACLADDRHKSFFDGVQRGAHGDPEFCIGILRALTVARQCQMRRSACSDGFGTFDWFDAMKDLRKEWVFA